ncbi:MAG: ATP-binding protein, partial [Bacteroidota bacterium]
FKLSVLSLPTGTKEAAELARWWNRESALNASALYLDCSKIDAQDKQRWQPVLTLVENVHSILITGGSTVELPEQAKRPKLVFEVPKPNFEEQLSLWKLAFGKELPTGLVNEFGKIATQFDLGAKTIAAIVGELKPRLSLPAKKQSDEATCSLGRLLWETCLDQTRPKLDGLAQKIEAVATWKDIVLPAEQVSSLEEMADQVKNRKKVYQEFGMEKTSARGLGISALFVGESGTGKTMASEVLANELQLDLYRIDLSQVVNKYIGETEKNLKLIFDAAEEGGSILLFDEADALFGKRSEVKDSHDRYSNIEVSYLLQRMESYKGLAILTTNMKSALDPAFLRRIRFHILFPHPDVKSREEIWRRVFPDQAPTENIDFEKLARLNLPGGNIRNIAINAAFLAAEENSPIRMAHLFQAARSEYRKLEKSFTISEINAMS